MKTIVVSAVSLRKGGTLTILRQCLDYLSQLVAGGGYRVIALVHRRELADYAGLEYIEFPAVIQSWTRRLWCEYVTMNKVSKQIGEIDLWLSLHDATPRVQAKRQAVYCQTSFPFLRWHWSDFRFDKKIPLFALLTKYTYLVNVQRNRYLIVQQEWLREGLSQMLGLPRERFVVAPPPRTRPAAREDVPRDTERAEVFSFLFVSTPDSHKGFEVLAEATRRLERRVGSGRFRVVLTMAGDENPYAHYIHKAWRGVESLEFAGLMDRPTLYRHYAQADCLVFPSRIETWGLPISEYLQVHEGRRPLILPDLPYAHETSQGAQAVAFFPSEDAEALSWRMQDLLEGNYASYAPNPIRSIASPCAHSWEELFGLLLQ